MRRPVASIISVWAALSTVLSGCPGSQVVATRPPPPPVVQTVTPPAAPLAPHDRTEVAISAPPKITGELTLAPLTASSSATAGVSIVDMSAADTQALLARLEPLPAVANAQAPALRPPSLMPPGPGTLQPIAFTAPTGAAVTERPIVRGPAVAAALEAPQILPVGDVPAESEIRIRFAEAMVAIEKLGPAPALATITPPVRGTWKWIDTHVAAFTAETPRLAQATEYTVTVPVGTKALSGAVLTTPATGTFQTPPVAIAGLYPTGRQRPDAPIAVQLDQDIDAAKLLPSLRVRTAKGAPVAITTTTLEAARAQWAHNPQIAFDAAVLGRRYVLIAPTSGQWPADTELAVTLGKGAPSAEGPRLSAQDSKRAFRIVAPFRALGIDCDYEGKPLLATTCSELSFAQVEFSTELDEKQFRAEMVQVEGGTLEDHVANSRAVRFKVPEGVNKRHAVRISDDLRDAYGQSLVGTHRVSLTASRYVYNPQLDAISGPYVIDPRFQIPQYVIDAQAVTAIHVELYKVQPSDFFAYQELESGKRKLPPGKRVLAKDFPVGDRYAGTVRLDLSPELDAGTGHLIAVTTATAAVQLHHYNWFRPKIVAWIQVSKLGITARIDQERIHAWVDDITPAQFLKPRAGVTTSLVIQNRADITTAAQTDATGGATLELPLPVPPPKLPNVALPDHATLLVATSGTDSTFAVLDRAERTVRVRNAEWYVTDDRFTYKPGEPVYMKGWVRWTHDGINPGLELPPPSDNLTWEVFDSKQNKIATGTTAFTDQGGFDFQFDLPKNTNLGSAQIALRTKDQTYSHRIAVQEFRTPAYAVNLDDDMEGRGVKPLILGEAIDMTAEAKYYAGGGLGGAQIKWDAQLEHASYKPPGWDLYAFDPTRTRGDTRWRSRPGTSATESTTLGGASNSAVRLGIAALPEGEPAVLKVDATVTDVDRQTIRASSRSIVVHPASLYVGMRLQPESDDKVLLVVTDIDGNLVPGVAIDVVLDATLYSEANLADAKIRESQHCTLTSAAAPVVCAFTPAPWDRQMRYRAVATIHDPRGRKNAAEYFVPYWRTADDKSTLSITADRPKYKPGDTAKLTIHSTILPATAVVSYARQGVISQRRLELKLADTPLELAMDVGYLENLHVQVDRASQRESNDQHSTLPLPTHTSAEVDLRVDLDATRLQIRTRPTKPLVEPGDQATFDVDVVRADKPVANAEVALLVVDEAVLALSGMNHPDPMEPFYRSVDSGTEDRSTLDDVHDEDEHLLGTPGFDRINLDLQGLGGFGTIGHGSGTGSGYGFGGGRGGMRGMSASVVTSRKDFRATAVFAPHLHTDAKGHATITVKMPDSLTRFRVVALATSETYFFGKGEGTIVTQRKINARTQAPRFLTQGDRFEVPVVVQNLDSTARTMDVAVRAANLTGGGIGKRVTVPAGQRAEVRFPFATAGRGKAVIQTIVTAGDISDASNVELPVYEPATTETFATYGTVDAQPAYEQLAVPADIFADVGGVETEVSSTQLQTLTDAYWYLRAYPFECAEQRSSRMLATTAMTSVLDAFAAPNRPTAQEQAQIQAADVAKLVADQNRDGGWGYWGDTPTDEFVTMQVITALRGSPGTTGALKLGVAHVQKLLTDTTVKLAKLEHGAPEAAYPISLAATALTALAATGLDERAAAQRLHTTALALGVYPVDAKARLLALVARAPNAQAMRTKLVADLVSATHETAAGATVTTSFTEGERLLLVSNNRTTALTLDALIRETPTQPLIMKLARGLLAARAHGRWRSTQENLAVLQAMRRYFDTYEKDVPNYTGKLWVGDVAYAEQTFAGRSNLRATAALDWTKLAPGSTHDIAVQKTGPGRMYYRIGITYAPKRVDLPALDAGFIVRRSYEAVDDPKDVQKTPTGYRIKLGARVLVVVEALNTTRRDGVALVDPLPAGFEAVNTKLAIAERAAAGAISTDWNHLETRDNRTEAFAATLTEGTHRLSYTARATTPGTFDAAPAKAEEMYSPETFGRSPGVVVEVY